MLLLIGGAVVFWIIWSFFKANSMKQSREFGIETRHIATNELGVPSDFYSKTIINHIEEIKANALHLGSDGGAHKGESWPRRLAYAIYYRHQKLNDSDNDYMTVPSLKPARVEPWMRELWQWADQFNMSRIFPRDPEEFKGVTKVHFTVYEFSDTELAYETKNYPSSLPKEIGNLVNLEVFAAGDLVNEEFYITAFKTLPEEICNLSKLKYLYLQGNRLQVLPDNIGNLKNLKHLKLGGNKLSELPPGIGDLDQLELLTVWQNDLTTLPPEIGKLKQLKGFSIWGNPITSLPEEITNLTKLEKLELSDLNGLIIGLTENQRLWIEDLKSKGCTVYGDEEKAIMERSKEQTTIRATCLKCDDIGFSIYTCPDCDGEGQVHITAGSLTICQRCDGKGLIKEYCFDCTQESNLPIPDNDPRIDHLNQWADENDLSKEIFPRDQEKFRNLSSLNELSTDDGVQTYQSYIKHANTYYESKQFTEAIEVLGQATSINPENVKAWLFLGIIYNESNQKTKSIEAYEKVLHINPELAEVWFNLGILYEKSNQNNKATEAYEQATCVNPEFAGAWLNLGIRYDVSNQNIKAINAYEQATRIDPELVGAWFNLGLIYNKLNQFTKAIDPYKHTIRINPQNSNAWFNLGLSYRNTNQHKNAIEAYKHATHIDPEFAKAWFNLGVCYVESTQYKEAVNAYKHATRIDPELAEAWNNLGVIYNKAKRFTEAIDIFKQAIRINPEDADAWFNIGISYKYSGQSDLSLKAYKRLKMLDPVMADSLNKVEIYR